MPATRMSGFFRALDRLLPAAVQVPAVVLLGLPVLGLLLALADTGGAAESLLLPGVRPLGLLLRSVVFSAAVAGGASLAGGAITWGVLGTRRGAALLAFVLPPLLPISSTRWIAGLP